MRTCPGVLAVLAATVLGCGRASSSPCPDGARLLGRAPPEGTLQWCAKPDGGKHGRWAEWHPNGKLKTEGQYVDGKMEGRWVSYFEDGVKQLEGEYRGGLKTGLWTLYYEEGPKNREEVHTPEARETKWTAWRSSGEKWAEGTLVGHMAVGPYSEWHPNGALAVRGTYEKGQKAGDWKYFDLQGQATDAPQGDFARD
nr:toxin-antitoxin system YwqK family antitoxin [Pyxidicoccus fallax]